MSSARPAVRSRRSGRTVVVTGAASPLGEAVTQALVSAVSGATGGSGGTRIARVVAVDTSRGRAEGATWRLGDVTSPDLVGALRGADAVVHLAAPTDLAAALADPDRREHAVRATQVVTNAAAAVGARRLLVVTSAMVYGAAADNPVPLPEDAVLAAPAEDGVIGDLLEVERILARTPRVHPGLAVTVLRPAALVGPEIDTVTTRHFEAPRLLSLRGQRDVWQFCHYDDVGTAVAVAVTRDLDGPLTVGCDGVLEQEDLERLSGLRRVELPAGLAMGTAQRLHRVGVLPTPASDLSYVVNPWVVSAARLRAAGWIPAYDNETCLGVLLEQVRGRHAVAARRLDRKDAALGAAGAAVALVGTAAVVRRRRRRGGGGG